MRACLRLPEAEEGPDQDEVKLELRANKADADVERCDDDLTPISPTLILLRQWQIGIHAPRNYPPSSPSPSNSNPDPFPSLLALLYL